MATSTRRAVSHNGATRATGPSGGPRSQAARPAGRRNAGRIALGVLVLVLSALGAVVLFSSAADRVAVIGVARDVPAGRELVAADLREVSISGGDGLRTVSADDAAAVVGRTAAVGLVAGSLLNPEQVAEGSSLPEGTVVAGAVLKAGQFPVGLGIGDVVEVIETTAADATGAGDAVSRRSATVVDLSERVEGQSVVTVSLAVASGDAAEVSAAGAAGRLSLVVTGP